MPYKAIDPKSLRRNKPKEEDVKKTPTPIPVSSGPVTHFADLFFNASPEKIRELTKVDRWQVRLFPMIDTLNALRQKMLEVVAYRQNKNAYKRNYNREQPEPIDIIGIYVYRTAQWQKSLDGKNLDRATDLVLAETEKVNDGYDEDDSKDRWKE